MNLCTGTRSSQHQEVCYEDGLTCPVCDLAEELGNKVDGLEERLKELEAEAEV